MSKVRYPAMRVIRALFVAALLPGAGMGQTRFAETGAADVDAYLQRVIEQTYIPGVVAMVCDADGVLFSAAYGRQNVAAGIPMAQDSIFRIASMTKPITSVAVMMLLEEGRIGLDDPVAKYIPELAAQRVFTSFDPDSKRYESRPAKGEITLRHLLTHTSGLGYAWSNPILYGLLGAGSPSDTSVMGLPLLFDPGTRWNYGESTRVLGSVIEVVSGEPLEAFLRARIFVPLGMRDTSYAVPREKLSRVVTVHTRDGDRLVESPNPTGEMAAAARGDGGLFSTAGDYVKFMQMLLRGGLAPDGRRLLTERSVALMGQNQIGDLRVELQPAANTVRARPFPLGAGRDTFGFGFEVTGGHEENGMRSAGSLAWAGINNTQFWIDPQRGVAAVLLMQYLPFYDDVAIEALQGFERRVYRALD